MSRDRFELRATDGKARAGGVHTPHGSFPTPAFMPVATQGSVKAVDSTDLEALGARIVLSNAYHLYLRPGVELIEEMGGLHSFMAWDGPVLTDSGGFQGFSLERLRRISEEGIAFKSHLDGSSHLFTPENSVQFQERLGADIIMPLDVCVPADSDRETVESALARTTRWAARRLDAHSESRRQLFGIVQGGLFEDLRERSVRDLVALDFPGYAIGGLSVGESKAQMYHMTAYTAGLLPEDKPRYLMGVGSPEDLVECVAAGVDMFDCVLPTRVARNGALFTPDGRVNVLGAGFRKLERPLQPGCDCFACRNYSAAYLHHLFRAKELLAYRLASIHNLRFVIRLTEEMRAAVLRGEFAEYRRDFLRRFMPTDEAVRVEQKRKWAQSTGRRVP